jgi:hypothetical protein
VAGILHHEIATKQRLRTCKGKTPYHKYAPDNLLESENYTVHADRQFITDKTIPAIEQIFLIK